MRQTGWRWWVGSGAFALGCIVNPGWVAGCKLGGTHAMEEQLIDKLTQLNQVGRWTFSDDGQQSYDVSLRLEQSRGMDQVALAPTQPWLLTHAQACDTHTFFQGAAACLDVYELAVEGVMSLYERGSDAPIVSDMRAKGTLAQDGALRLAFGAATANELEMVDRDGKFVVASFSGAHLGEGSYTIQKR